MFYIYILHGMAGLVLSYILLATILRYDHSKKKAGKIVIELGQLNYFVIGVLSAIPLLFIALALIKFKSDGMIVGIESLLVAIFIGSYTFQSLCRNHLAENGIITAQGFIAWEDVYSYQFDDNIFSVRFFKLGNQKVAFQKKIKLVNQEQIDLLQKNLKKHVKKNR